jgi:hypothetical protein
VADWREINRIAKDPAAARILAKSLSQSRDADWSPWEIDFLESMRANQEPLTTRQAEKLMELRDANQSFSTFDGFNIETLIDKCFQARLDLNKDEDIGFMERLRESGTRSIKRRNLSRLLRCCRQLLAIEPVEPGS